MSKGTPGEGAGAIPNRLLHPRDEAAVLLGISERTVRYLVSSGLLTANRIGKRQLIHIDEIRRFAAGDHPNIPTAAALKADRVSAKKTGLAEVKPSKARGSKTTISWTKAKG